MMDERTIERPDTCPFTNGECTAERCVFYQILDDWEGCPLLLAQSTIKQLALSLARKADSMMNTTLGTLLEKKTRKHDG